MITNISLQNFQGFRSLQSFRVSDVNLVFGPNSTGKTSIQRALRLFASSVLLGPSSDLPSPTNLPEENGFIFDSSLEASGLTLAQARNSLANDSETMFVEIVFRSRHQWNQGNEQIEFEGLDKWQEITDAFNFPKFRIRVTDEKVNGKNTSLFEPIDVKGMSPWRLQGGELKIFPKHWWWKKLFGKEWNVSKVENLRWFGLQQSRNFPKWPDSHVRQIMEEINNEDLVSLDHVNFLTWKAFLDSIYRMLEQFSLFELEPNRPTIDLLEKPFNERLREYYKSKNLSARAISQNENNKGKTINLSPDQLKAAEEALFGGVNIEAVKEDFLTLTNGRYVPLVKEKLNTQDFGIMKNLPFDFGVFNANLVFDRYSGGVQTFKNVGHGLSSVLPILEQINRFTHDFVYIPQPETHLHPKMQGKLMKIILARASRNYIQVFIETHSENMLLSLQKEIRNRHARNDDVEIIYTDSVQLKETDSEWSGSFDLTSQEMSLNMPTDLVLRGENCVYNMNLDKAGELIDPFPESFAEMRASYLFDFDGDEG